MNPRFAPWPAAADEVAEPARALTVEALTAEAFAPFGRVLGGGYDPAVTGFSHPGSDFWHVHDFDAGTGGQVEVLWVNYRNDSLRLRALEAHWLTEQAIVPLGGEIVHVVCPGREDDARTPDVTRLRAFRVGDGQGVCMQPGCWHASFVLAGQTTCLMLTRHSTTADLVETLQGRHDAVESSIVELAALGEGEVALQV